MSSKSLLCYLVHTVRAYLHLYPSSLFRHQGDVQGLIAVGFRMAQPVAQTVWVTLVDFRDSHIDVKAFVDFLLALVRGEDDADCQDVVYLVEGDVFVLHLAPDRVGRLHTFLDLVFDAHLLQGSLNRIGELVEQLVARSLCGSQFRLDAGIFLGVLVAETQVLQFRLDLIESQSVRQWGIDIQRLASYLILFVGRL